MTTIPGAEYAPIIAFESWGQAEPTEEERELVEASDAILYQPVHRTVRRLVVSRPDDRHTMRYRAALKLGASPEAAEMAQLTATTFRLGDEATRLTWSLVIRPEHRTEERDVGGGWIDRRTVTIHDGHLLAIGEASDLEHAHALLCAKVWGHR